MLTFGKLAEISRQRCEASDGFDHRIGSWSLSDWVTAALGELGEAANVVKKLNRHRDGMKEKLTPQTLMLQLKREIGDAAVYLDLLAQAAGFSLADCVRDAFNSKSVEKGYKGLL